MVATAMVRTLTHSLRETEKLAKRSKKILVNRKQFICCWQRQSTSTLKYTEKRLHILINIVASRALCVCVSATRRTPSTTHISISLKRRFRDILRHQLNLEITQSSSSSLYSIHFIRNNFKPQEDKRNKIYMKKNKKLRRERERKSYFSKTKSPSGSLTNSSQCEQIIPTFRNLFYSVFDSHSGFATTFSLFSTSLPLSASLSLRIWFQHEWKRS